MIGEIDERAEHIERHRLVGAADHLVDRLHQVDDAEQRDQRAALDRVGDAVDPGRQEAAEGLREDDVGEALAEGQADRLGRLHLARAGSSRRRRADISITCAVLNSVSASTAAQKDWQVAARAAGRP